MLELFYVYFFARWKSTVRLLTYRASATSSRLAFYNKTQHLKFALSKSGLKTVVMDIRKTDSRHIYLLSLLAAQYDSSIIDREMWILLSPILNNHFAFNW